MPTSSSRPLLPGITTRTCSMCIVEQEVVADLDSPPRAAVQHFGSPLCSRHAQQIMRTLLVMLDSMSIPLDDGPDTGPVLDIDCPACVEEIADGNPLLTTPRKIAAWGPNGLLCYPHERRWARGMLAFAYEARVPATAPLSLSA